MLKKRIITAAILIPLVLCCILYAHPFVLLGLVALTYFVMLNEWSNLVPLKSRKHKILFVLMGFVFGVASLFCFQLWLPLGLLLWCLSFLAIMLYPKSAAYWGKPMWVMIWAFCNLPLACICATALYSLPHGPWLVIYVMGLVALSDSSAYFVGRLYGQHPLIPNVSPKKTIEGAIGGVMIPLCFAIAVGYFAGYSPLGFWSVLSLVTIVVAIFGDLFISMLKRRVDLKDTGALLPGHGGLLDRVDSMLSAYVWFFFGYAIFFWRP